MLETTVLLVLGLLIGSFLNVVILRYNTGRSLGGRSGCLSCNKRLHWYELLPVFSYLAQKGKCRGCASKISIQYPLVEVSTAILFALVAWRFADDLVNLIFFLLVIPVLVVLVAYDTKHKIIPNFFVYFFIFLALVKVLLISPGWDGWLGGLVLAGFLGFLWLVSSGRWLGFGDVKLVLGIGLILGWRGGLSALCLSVWIGAAVGLILIFIGRAKLFRFQKYITMKSELPFAPFLVLGFLLNLLFSINVLPF